MASSKINLDKYYSSQELADYCTQKAIEIIGIDNITEFIESSAGNGRFINSLEKYAPNIPYLAYDIEPEDYRIMKQDYLKLEKEYKPKLCVIGNFPYGVKNTLSVQFYKKSLTLGDYICSILPISQLNNNMQMYEFDLIYSEDLKPQMYSGVKVHCCWNIYVRNPNGYNLKPDYTLTDVTVWDSRYKHPDNYDLRLLAWGTGSNGKPLGAILSKEDKTYAKEFYITFNNEEYREQVTKILREVKWEEIYKQTVVDNLLKWQVYKYLKDNINGIK